MVEYTNPTVPNTPRNRGDYDAPHMTSVTPLEDFRTVLINRVSWGAVSSGVAVAVVSQFVLSLLGVGIGFTTIQYGADVTPTAETLSFGAISWWAISGIIAALAGGFIAGRMAGDTRESTAGLHGLTSWAVSIIVVGMFVAAGAGSLIGGTLNVTGIGGTMSVRNGIVMSTAVVAAPEAAYNAPATEGDISMADETMAPVTVTPRTTTPSPATVRNSAVTVDAAVLSSGALICAAALLLGALAAWFGGRMGVVQPTITTLSASPRKNLH